MKKAKLYLALIILDIILIIMWPVALFCASYSSWLAFFVGAVWCSDWYALFNHIENYRLCKEMEELCDD